MKWVVTVIVLFVTVAINSQNKDGISIVQYSAEFVKANEISLSEFSDYNTETLYMGKAQAIFKKENIKYIPTIVLYSDGEEIIKIESGISLKLPENCRDHLDFFYLS